MSVTRPRGRPLEMAGLFAFGVAALYFGQGILVPLVLAILVAFALNPFVDRIHRLGMPQLGAVLIAVLMVTGLVLLASYVTVTQLLKLAGDIPRYQQTIIEKLQPCVAAARTTLSVS